jgi:hypothetical protein
LSIPEWFDVENYGCTKEWGKKQWSNAIFTRLLIPECIEMHADFKNRGDMKAAGEHIAVTALVYGLGLDPTYSELPYIDALNAIIKDLHCDPDRINRRDFSWIKTKNSAAKVIDMRRLGLIHHRLTRDLSKNTVDYLAGKSLTESPDDVEIGRKSLRERELDLGRATDYWGTSVLVSINVDMPNEILLEQLEQIIRDSREKAKVTNLGRSASEVDLRRWYDNKVLAYYDLVLLAHVNGAALTNQRVGARLFPKEFDVSLADRIRKVVKPLSSLVFQQSTRNMLDMAISMEDDSTKFNPEENS